MFTPVPATETSLQTTVPSSVVAARPGANITATVPISTLSDHFFPGGRLYIESFVTLVGVNTHDSTSRVGVFLPPVPLRVLVDLQGWTEPRRPVSIVPQAVGGTVAAVVAVAAIVLYVLYRRRKHAQQVLEEQESVRGGAYAKMKAM